MHIELNGISAFIAVFIITALFIFACAAFVKVEVLEEENFRLRHYKREFEKIIKK